MNNTNQQEYIVQLSPDTEALVVKYLISRHIHPVKIGAISIYLITVSPTIAQEIRQVPGVIAVITNDDIATIGDIN